MRRVRYSVAASLDGYIAGPEGEYDWIIMDPDIDFGALTRRFDTLLIGRRTFEGMTQKGQGGPLFGMKTLVFSHTLDPTDHPSVDVLGEGAEEELRRVRSEPGKDIWLFGGGLLFRSLLAANLVDSVEVAIIPVVLGGGIPLVPAPAAQAQLELTSHNVYPKTGTVFLDYAISRTQS